MFEGLGTFLPYKKQPDFGLPRLEPYIFSVHPTHVGCEYMPQDLTFGGFCLIPDIPGVFIAIHENNCWPAFQCVGLDIRRSQMSL